MNAATYPIPFDPFDGTDSVVLQVSEILEGFARGADGDCAFCDGDPTATSANANERITAYILRNMASPRPLSCPCCDGRPP